MAEPIFKRMQRIVSAGIESATDAAERLSGGGLMRHAIREVDQAMDGVKKRLDATKARRLQADWRQAEIRDRAADFSRDARFAMDKGREDLARVAVAQQLELEEEAARLAQVQRNAEREAAQLTASLDELRERKAQMEHEYRTLEAAKRDATAAAGDPQVTRKVQRAESAFERARLAAGAASSAADAPTAAAVDEIRAVRREDEIAARLARLRGGAEPAKPKQAAGGRRKA